MTAKSYLGTMCIGVATTGVEGLKQLFRKQVISNWYAYYRTGGLNLPAIGWQGDDVNILQNTVSAVQKIRKTMKVSKKHMQKLRMK